MSANGLRENCELWSVAKYYFELADTVLGNAKNVWAKKIGEINKEINGKYVENSKIRTVDIKNWENDDFTKAFFLIATYTSCAFRLATIDEKNSFSRLTTYDKLIKNNKTQQDWISNLDSVTHHMLRNASGHKEDPNYKKYGLDENSCKIGRKVLAELTIEKLGEHMKNALKAVANDLPLDET